MHSFFIDFYQFYYTYYEIFVILWIVGRRTISSIGSSDAANL
jgi:hypothetical protein